MERLLMDLRYAVRGMIKRPGFSLVIILTLALGIGANTAIFSVVNAVLLSPLPFSKPDQLVVLTARNQARNVSQQPLSYLNVIDWRAQNRVFEHLSLVRGESMSLTSQPEPERVAVIRTSVNILELLGVEPRFGRNFRADEESPGNASVAIVGHAFWQRHGGDPEVLGEKLTLDGKAYTVIGILAPGLKHPGLSMASLPPSGADIWIPLVPAANEQNRNFANMRVMARIKPGMTLTEAQAEMNTLASRSAAQYPENNANLSLELTPLNDHLTGRARRALWILLGAVACVLLIACANVANLLLARAAGRQTEMALRAALGASRTRLIRQLLTECVLLSLSGALLGLLLAYQGVAFLGSINAASIPRAEEISISLPVLAFTLLLALATGLTFGLLPALQSSSVHLTEFLKEGKKGAGSSVRNRRLLGALVIGEIAIALVLLTGAGLLTRSFRTVSQVDPGFDLKNVLTFSVPLPQTTYGNQQQQLSFHERAIERLRTVSGVELAAGAFRVPVFGFATVIFTVEGQPVSVGSEPSADYRTVSTDYMQAMGMRMRAGRMFMERDKEGAPDVVIVNEELARRFWPDNEAVGKRLQVAAEKTRWREVVGVVRDAKLSGLDAPTDPAVYVPFSQNTWPNALRISALVVRTRVEPHSLIPAIRSELRAIDPGLPITQIRTMEEIVAESLSARRFNTVLLTIFAVVAGLLAAIGIYGVMSYNVTHRAHELGVRMALGAGRGEIIRMVTREGATLATIGIVIGAAAAVMTTRLMSSLLFGVSASDPLTFVVNAVLLCGVTLVASYLPARRAARTDPMVALRRE
ncbi:MAG: ABC transporter permease [Acidobacteriota bacterium]